MTLSMLTIILSAYVAWESFEPICAMPEGMADLCHKAKYVLSFASSIAFAYYAIVDVLQLLQLLQSAENITPEMRWLAFGSAGTLAMFVWPRTVWKFRQFVDDMEHFYDHS